MDAKMREETYRRRRISARADGPLPHEWDPEAYEKDPVIFAIHHLFVLTDTERRIKTDLKRGQTAAQQGGLAHPEEKPSAHRTFGQQSGLSPAALCWHSASTPGGAPP